MKKLLFLLFILLSTGAIAQTDVQRTAKTKVADALAKLPAQDDKTTFTYMADIASAGEEGVFMLVDMLKNNPKADPTTVEYAINGLSYFVMSKEGAAQRAVIEKAYTKALEGLTDRDQKAFLIRQIEIVYSDASAPAMAKYITDDYLCSFATHAMSRGGDESKKTLRDALSSAQGAPQIAIIQAIGALHDATAESQILALAKATTGNDNLKKELHFCLGRVGSKISMPYLSAEAAKVNYASDKAYATDGYLRLLNRLTEIGQSAEAEKEAASLLAKVSSDKIPNVKSAALYVLMNVRKANGLPLVLNALNDKSIVYRRAALRDAIPYADEAFYAQLVSKLPSASPEVQKDIVIFLGTQRAKSAIDGVLSLIKSNTPAVRAEAVKAAAFIGGDKALNAICELMLSSNSEDVKSASEALAWYKGDISQAVRNCFRKANDEQKIALLSIIENRSLIPLYETVFGAIKESKNEKVVDAAYSALKNIVWQKDLYNLFGLLETANPKYYNDIQAAIVNALGDRSTAAKLAVVMERFNQMSNDKRGAYYGILARLGSNESLAIVTNGFNKSSGLQKELAFDALTNWNGLEACYEIYAICKADASYIDKGLKGYIRLVETSRATAEQKFLFLRSAMELAKSAEQKNGLLKLIGNTRTFGGVVLAGQYLDDKAVSMEAARVIQKTLMEKKEFDGAAMKQLFGRAKEILAPTQDVFDSGAAQKFYDAMSNEGGFVPMFNGKDLTGWKGLVENPIKRSQMNEKELAAAQAKADQEMRSGWSVKDGLLVFNGHGNNLCTEKKYGDFEMFVDWMITPKGDAGIYLRGTPQVQIWDTSRVEVGAQVGSGGLYNNTTYESKPLVMADNKVGEWNSFHIIMKGERVTVYLNGQMVVNNVPLENYWDRKLPIFREEQIELQAHGTYVAYRDLYIKEIPRPKLFELSAEEKAEGFKMLFDGESMHEWVGNLAGYVPEEGIMQVRPEYGRGNLFTRSEYKDFVFRFEFKLTPGANNGLGIRAPLKGDAAYVGSELQILDNESPIYANLKPYQYHGSLYGMLPAKRGYLKPVGEWNYQEVTVKGTHVTVILNGTTILDGDWAPFITSGTPDGREHPGLKNQTGHIGFLGHGDRLQFRNIRIKEL